MKRLLEIGIGYEELMKPFVPEYTPASSLKMWEEFFPEAQITGLDVRHEACVYQTERVMSMICDQSDPLQLLNLIQTVGRPDIIIDDGSHETEHQIISAVTLGPYLRAGGIYIIEDVRESEVLEKEIGGSVVRFNKRPDDCLLILRR